MYATGSSDESLIGHVAKTCIGVVHSAVIGGQVRLLGIPTR